MKRLRTVAAILLILGLVVSGCGRPASQPAQPAQQPSQPAQQPSQPAQQPSQPAQPAPAPAKELRIGIVGPMEFIQGEHHWAGATMAAAEVNAAGGIKVGNDTYTVTLVKVETNEMLSVTDAASAVERAIARDNVQFLIGGFRSEAVVAMQEVAMDEKVIFIGAGPGHPGLNTQVKENYDRYKYWFRLTPINSNYLAQTSFLQLGMVAHFVRQALGVEKPKVAMVAEAAVWADPLIPVAEHQLPNMGLELIGVWRPSPIATDVTAELTAIEAAEPHIIWTWFSGPVGVPFARQWGERKVPAALAGINVEAQKLGFRQATGGAADYVLTLNTYGRVEITDRTIPFYDRFTDEVGEFPTYTAGTYDAILILADALQRAGTLDTDAVIKALEATDYVGTSGRVVFDETHDVVWGPGYVTGTGSQWQEGELVTVWPMNWEGITYPGTVMYKLPPWMLE